MRVVVPELQHRRFRDIDVSLRDVRIRDDQLPALADKPERDAGRDPRVHGDPCGRRRPGTDSLTGAGRARHREHRDKRRGRNPFLEL